MWCIQTGGYKAAAGEWWEGWSSCVCHGRQQQATGYCEGGSTACSQEQYQSGVPWHRRTSSCWWGHDERACRDKGESGHCLHHTDCGFHDRSGCSQCSDNVQWQDRYRWCHPHKAGWWYQRRCRTVDQGSHRQANPVLRYGRKAYRSGTILSGSYGKPNPRHGWCWVAHRESPVGYRWGEGKGDGTEVPQSKFWFQRFSWSDGSARADGWHAGDPFDDARHGKSDEECWDRWERC